MPNLVDKERGNAYQKNEADRKKDRKVLEIVKQMENEGYSWSRSGKETEKADKELARRYKEATVKSPQESMKIKPRY